MIKQLKHWLSNGGWISWLVLIILVAAVVAWVRKQEELPQTLRFAAGSPNGQYHIVGNEIALLLEARTGREVEVLTTSGAVENAELLQAGLVDLALLQSGSADMQDIRCVAPLYPEPIHVIARKSAGLTSLEELVQTRIAIGMKGSAMHEDAIRILHHLGMESADMVETEDWANTLEQDSTLVGAMVTTGMLHPGFRKLMAGGEFELLPIMDAGALSILYPYMRQFTIPRGMYSGYPPNPPEAVETVTATAFIGVRPDVQITLVEEVLLSIYRDRLPGAQPAFIPPTEIEDWPTVTHHVIVNLYHDPIKDIGRIGTFASSISAVKELLLAIAAGIFLIFRRLSAHRKLKANARLAKQQAILNQLLDETLAIEDAQMATTDIAKLGEYLNDLTKVKLRALNDSELIELRERSEFAIFMMQCTALTHKLQSKISHRMM